MRPATWARPWTAAEDAALREPLEAKELAVRLGRSEGGVHHRRARLGIVRRRRWTRADIGQLRDLWGEGMSLRRIARHLGRTSATVYIKAQAIGLSLGVPDGFEYLSHAAKRTGYCTSQLWQILRAAGVRPKAALARTVERRAGHRFHFVEPLDVDDAVALWLSTEPVESAAKRLGVSGHRLRGWLRAEGVKDQRRIPRAHWRVPSEVIERVVAQRRAA
jgi:hypothetical protein